jgi:hypothetical protein
MNIQRTDMRAWAMLPITNEVRWAVWKANSKETTVAIFAPGSIVPTSSSNYNRLSAGDTLIIDAKDNQISEWPNSRSSPSDTPAPPRSDRSPAR